MKSKLLSTLSFLIIMSGLIAQAPQMFNYQAVARDASGNIITNQKVSIRFTIHDITADGLVVFRKPSSLLPTNSVCLRPR